MRICDIRDYEISEMKGSWVGGLLGSLELEIEIRRLGELVFGD